MLKSSPPTDILNSYQNSPQEKKEEKIKARRDYKSNHFSSFPFERVNDFLGCSLLVSSMVS